MDSLARFAITHARFTILLIVSLLVAGAGIFTTQPRQEDPEIVVRSAQVLVQLPGLSPERIEQLLTLPIEEAIKEIPEIDEIRSVSSTGVAIITPEAGDAYTDMAPIWAQLRNKMDDLKSSLPDGTIGPFVNDDYGRVAVVTIALTGPDYTLAELEEVAKDLRDAFGALPLVARVDLYGVQDETIWLDYDPKFIAQFGIDPASVTSLIRSQNAVLSGGEIEADGERIVIEPSGDFRSLDEIRNLAIAAEDGSVLYLRDLGTLRRGYVDPPTSPVRFDGEPAIVLGVSMVSGSNVVELGRQLTAELDALRPSLPIGMALDVAIYQPDLVQASVDDATSNLLQTMIVVLVVVMLFLGWRAGLIVGAVVPLTMMATLVLMFVFEIALHRVSIAAIIVALGLLVDNGVVIAEDIRRRMLEGESRLDAVLATPRSLAVPLLTSSLTTVLAFLPLMLISDGTGEFLRSLGQVLTFALLSSWVISISILPALCYAFLPDPEGADDGDALKASPVFAGYRRVLEWLLGFRVPFLVAAVALLFVAGQVFGGVKQRALGPSERNQFTVYLDLPAEAAVQETIAAAEELDRFLRSDERVRSVLSYVGGGGPRFFLALAPNDAQPNKAFLVVNTAEAGDVPILIDTVDEYLLRELPQARGRAEQLFLGPAALGTVELRIRGPEQATLRRLAREVESAFLSVPGSMSIRNDWENAVVKIQVQIDQERARRAGVSSTDIAGALEATFDGATISDYRERDKVIPIVVRAREEDRHSLDTLRSIEIYSTQIGGAVPLLQVADFSSAVEPSRIRRIDRQRAITVAGKHVFFTSTELWDAMQPAMAEIDFPPGYALTVEGEIKGQSESNGKLFAYAPHALFGILLLLVLQFDSFRRPGLVLATIPLVFIGGAFGLRLTSAFFDFTAMLGFFSLAGIIINNGIVLIDRVDQARDEGMSVDEAVIDAALARARPIVMTTITTVVGLLPLALFGGEFWFGMAVVIMGGLAVASVLTLGFVPVLYSLLFRRADSPVAAEPAEPEAA